MAREYDSPWKEALELYLESLLELLFADIHAAIDWSKGYESLDTELNEIVREAELGPTVADKLFRVWLRNGEDVWLLMHIEVQSQRHTDFGRRMFTYSYRIIDRFNGDVVSLAILADNEPNWRPNEYIRERLGTRSHFRFRPAKLLDWVNRLEELEQNPSPIAVVICAHLQSLLTHGNPILRYAEKRRLFVGLFGRGLTEEGIRELIRLIDWLLELPTELQATLRTEMYAYEQEKKMPYVTSFERLAREEGEQKGRQEGRQEGLLEGITLALESKFGEAGTAFAQEIRTVTDTDKLRRIQRDLIRTTKTIEELRALLG